MNYKILLRFLLPFIFTLSAIFTIVKPSISTPIPSSTKITISPQKSDFKGTEITGFDEQGNKYNFQIRGVEIDPLDPEKEIELYTVFYQDKNQKWQNLCRGDEHFPAKAIALQGSWDQKGNYLGGEERVSFSCANGALTKCVRNGYKPWKNINGVSLRNHHQACVRMTRADYCGDGVSHTKDGTMINVYDDLDIQRPDIIKNMVFEAAWGVDGAYCINHVRWPEGLAYVQKVCPQRLTTKVKGGNHCPTFEQAQKNFPQALLFNDSAVRK